jgi:hypothetical protein
MYIYIYIYIYMYTERLRVASSHGFYSCRDFLSPYALFKAHATLTYQSSACCLPSEELLFRVGKKKSKAIPRTCGGSYETPRLLHFTESGLSDGGEVVSPTHRPPLYP